MYIPYADFTQRAIKANEKKGKNKIDMTFSVKLDLHAFTGMTAARSLEIYKSTCDFKERATLMYFCKAITAFNACVKMYEILKKSNTIVGKRIDSDIITAKSLHEYINETYQSLFNAQTAITMISDDNHIFYKIIDNSMYEFVEKMQYISEKLGVEITWLTN